MGRVGLVLPGLGAKTPGYHPAWMQRKERGSRTSISRFDIQLTAFGFHTEMPQDKEGNLNGD